MVMSVYMLIRFNGTNAHLPPPVQRILIHMDKVHIKHDHYSSNAKGVKDLRRGEEFRILHYAGDVTYSVLNFMDKNKDTFFQDLKRLLFGCKLKLLQEMWPEGANPIGEVTKRPITAGTCLLYTSPSPRDRQKSRMPSSA